MRFVSNDSLFSFKFYFTQISLWIHVWIVFVQFEWSKCVLLVCRCLLLENYTKFRSFLAWTLAHPIKFTHTIYRFVLCHFQSHKVKIKPKIKMQSECDIHSIRLKWYDNSCATKFKQDITSYSDWHTRQLKKKKPVQWIEIKTKKKTSDGIKNHW